MESLEILRSTNGNDSSKFLNDDFLLQSDVAKRLYHDHVKDLPIIDYHNHLIPKEIAENKKFENMTALWLKGDHYKWRAMRAFGIDEKYITGDATDEQKFMKWASVVPYSLKNPLFHWTQMELLKPFNINTYLNEQTAAAVYKQCNEMLQQDSFSSRSLLQYFNVELVGTTDDPCDDLRWHQQIKDDEFHIKILPSFRPDKILDIENKDSFLSYVASLEEAVKFKITDVISLLGALQKRVDYFHDNDCNVADHGLSQMPAVTGFNKEYITEFNIFINNKSAKSFSNPEAFTGFILQELCKMYHKKNWVQKFHLGALRNNNSRMLRTIGTDGGYDSIGDFRHAEKLSAFLNELDNTDQLAKTILYNNNPADNELFVTMTGNFNNSEIKGKIQYGPPWWYLDQKNGIEKHLNDLANMSLVSTFIGMTTDSRSFLSYSRHEYFRRILCNLFAIDILKGELPGDEKWIGGIISDICYYNARNYFKTNNT
ncbi:glucuronate isomerase [Ginsengibacter hankyongi]|uniref:Uronate isomerase n=1 Tax=Ginsengibacter hankyongi TaxID=2607284 RepID=A0A5J5IJE5_9BACT|nr:glucuronate isomerase [Ginsengibacter hankyongi]KAA9041185.1 glucuronate isomerase [Ginsengibacter hankyongi]